MKIKNMQHPLVLSWEGADREITDVHFIFCLDRGQLKGREIKLKGVCSDQFCYSFWMEHILNRENNKPLVIRVVWDIVRFGQVQTFIKSPVRSGAPLKVKDLKPLLLEQKQHLPFCFLSPLSLPF